MLYTVLIMTLLIIYLLLFVLSLVDEIKYLYRAYIVSEKFILVHNRKIVWFCHKSKYKTRQMFECVRNLTTDSSSGI